MAAGRLWTATPGSAVESDAVESVAVESDAAAGDEGDRRRDGPGGGGAVSLWRSSVNRVTTKHKRPRRVGERAIPPLPPVPFAGILCPQVRPVPSFAPPREYAKGHRAFRTPET